MSINNLQWHTLAVLCFELVFFFQAEDGIRDVAVTGVQTCALPISPRSSRTPTGRASWFIPRSPPRDRRLPALRHRRILHRSARYRRGGARRVSRGRSEERRVGEEGRTRWSPDH